MHTVDQNISGIAVRSTCHIKADNIEGITCFVCSKTGGGRLPKHLVLFADLQISLEDLSI